MRVGELCGEVVDLGRLAGEGLDHEGAVELLLQVAEEDVHLGADRRAVGPDLAQEEAEVQGVERHEGQDHQREPAAAGQQQRRDGQRAADVGQDRDRLARDERLQGADVVHQARDDRPGGRPVVVGQVEALEAVVELVAEVADHPLPDPADDPGGGQRQPRLGGEDREQAERVAGQGRPVPRGHHPVDQPLHQEGDREGQQARHDRQDGGQRDSLAVGGQELQDAAGRAQGTCGLGGRFTPFHRYILACRSASVRPDLPGLSGAASRRLHDPLLRRCAAKADSPSVGRRVRTGEASARPGPGGEGGRPGRRSRRR